MILFATLLYSLGWALAHALVQRLGKAVVLAFATPLGWLYFGTLSLIFFWTGLMPNTVSLIGIAFLFIAFVWFFLKPRYEIRDGIFFSVGLLATFCLAGIFSLGDFHYLSEDGLTFVTSGKILHIKNFIAGHFSAAFLDFGSLPIVFQSFAAVFGADYNYLVSPLFGVSLFCALGVWFYLNFSYLKTMKKIGLFLLSLYVLITTPLFLVHTQTIHGILPSALFLIWFWIAATLNNRFAHREWLHIAFISLLGFTLCRPEGPLYAALFLAIWLGDEKLDLKEFRYSLFLYTLLITAYYAVLMVHDFDRSDPILTKNKIGVVLAPLLFLNLAVYLLHCFPQKLSFYRRKSGTLSVMLLFCAYVLLFCIQPKHMGISLWFSILNFVQVGGWEFTGIGICVLALFFCHKIPASIQEKMLLQAMSGFLLLLQCFSFFRLAYRPSYWDTANRMTLLLLPIALMWIWIRAFSISRNSSAN